MNLEIPKFHETFNPILEILSNGETIHTRELQRLVIEKYFSSLTQEQLSEKTK
jgi:restriction system protein